MPEPDQNPPRPPRVETTRRREIRIVLGAALLALAILGLPLCIGIWLPDVFFDREYVLAEATSAEGYKFRVQQHWNHGDFYTTELYIVRPEGTTERRLVDPDDDKHWSLPLVIDESRRTTTVDNDGWTYEFPWDQPAARIERKRK